MRRYLGVVAALLSAALLLWAASEGPNSAGAGATDGDAGIEWADPGNITSSNDSRATAALLASESTEGLGATQFGFSIPASVTVDGIEASIERRGIGSGACEDNKVRLLIGGSESGNNKGVAGAWPGSDGTATYGGAADLWGITPTLSQINATNFGFVVKADETSTTNSEICEVDHMTLTVTYTLQPKVIITESRNAGRIESIKGEKR